MVSKRCVRVEQSPIAIYLDTLVTAYAEVGRFSDAVMIQTRALEAVEEAAAELQQRLESYLDRRAWREPSN